MNDRTNVRDGEPLLVRIELTYSDGTVSYLEDEAAEDWRAQMGGAAVMAWAHGQRNEQLPWKSRRAWENK